MRQRKVILFLGLLWLLVLLHDCVERSWIAHQGITAFGPSLYLAFRSIILLERYGTIVLAINKLLGFFLGHVLRVNWLSLRRSEVLIGVVHEVG